MYDYQLRHAMRLHLEADFSSQGTMVRSPGGRVLAACGNSLSLRPRSELTPRVHHHQSRLIPICMPSTTSSTSQFRCPTRISRHSSSKTTCGWNLSRAWSDVENIGGKKTSWTKSKASADFDRVEPAAESRDEKWAKVTKVLWDAAKSQVNVHGALQGSDPPNHHIQKTASSYHLSGLTPIAKVDTFTDGRNTQSNQAMRELEHQHLSSTGDKQKTLDHHLGAHVGPSLTQQHRTCFTHSNIFGDRKDEGRSRPRPNAAVSSSEDEAPSDKITCTQDTKQGVTQKLHRSEHRNSVSGQFDHQRPRRPIASPVETKKRSSPTQISRDASSDWSKLERRPLVPDRTVKNSLEVNVKPSNHQQLNVSKILDSISFQRWSHKPLTTSDSDMQLLTKNAQNFLGKTHDEYRTEGRTRRSKERGCKVCRSSISLLLESFRERRLDRSRRKCRVKRRK